MVTKKAANIYRSWGLRLTGLCIAFCTSGCDVSPNQGGAQVSDSDPIVVDYPVAYVHRSLPTDADGNAAAFNLLDPAAFHPGAQLVLKDRASTSAPEHILTDRLFSATADGTAAQYDVKDLSVSANGRKLLFSLRAPAIEGADEDEQPTWDIWLYDLDGDEGARLRPLMDAMEAARGHDVAPQFLPSGKIVFSSNRQADARTVLTDELRTQYSGLDDKRAEEAFVLHVWWQDGRGEHIEQITYNVSQDLQPTVLENGNLLYLRRDGINRHARLSLYTAKPDGTNVQLYYGYHSQATGTNDTAATFTRPRPLPDGRTLVILQPSVASRWGGDIVAIDGENFIDIDQPTSNSGGGSGQESLSAGMVETSGSSMSLTGSYSSAYPFYDGTGRLLVSWSPCRAITPDTEEVRPCTDETSESDMQAEPLYGLWIYNPNNGTQLPIKFPEEGVMLTDAVVMAPAISAANWLPDSADSMLVQEKVGTVHIRSVYDIDGVDTAPDGLMAVADPARTPTDERPVRFLRIVKNVPIPDDNVLDFDNSIFGQSAAQGMRDIVGYVPVEPDGSALFKVPANIPFMLDLLDADGKRIGSRHENWLQVRAGEQRECTGCHTRNSTLPHGRHDAEVASINPGALGGIAFANTRLLDSFGTPHPPPEFGETMAEYYGRINGPRTPAVDIVFDDEWTDPASASPGTDINLRYVDIAANGNPGDANCAPLDTQPSPWELPVKKQECVMTGGWHSDCRITIHYIKAIAPLWQADRRVCGDLGEVITDNTCTSCHTRTRDGLVQIPAGQLELTAGLSPDNNDYITSYVELLFDDLEVGLSADGALEDIQIPTGGFLTDGNGELVLDENGNPQPEYRSEPVAASMSRDGARASGAFFDVFQAGATHAGMLSTAEQKLIAEWLDIGAQYYNDPFDAPAD